MSVHHYLQVFAIAIWFLTHALEHAAPVLLPVTAGFAGLRALKHRRKPC